MTKNLQRKSLFAVVAAMLLAGCPTSKQYPVYPSSYSSPTPSSGAQEITVSGVVYNVTTGQPVSAAFVVLDNKTQALTGMDGSFTATRSALVKAPSVTVLKTGYVNLTVHGYQGGMLRIPPKTTPTPEATESMTVQLSAPAGLSSTIVSVAVKPVGYTYAIAKHLGSVNLSEAGTGSIKLTVPVGDATILAYGWDGQAVGSKQASVSSSLDVTLTQSPDYETYQTDVPLLKTDGSVLSRASYFLTWPGDTPAHPNKVMIGDITGLSTHEPFDLPPASAFGIAGAHYTVTGSALKNTANRPMIAGSSKSGLLPGNHVMALLETPISSKYRPGDETFDVTFRALIDQGVAGANAYTADFSALPAAGGAWLWEVISLGESTESLDVPVLPGSLRSLFSLSAGTTYQLQRGSAKNPLSDDVDYAQTLDEVSWVTYNKN
ncbi:MAG TPA: hypothetical protein V6D00_01600 [Pantanalinema sp.]